MTKRFTKVIFYLLVELCCRCFLVDEAASKSHLEITTKIRRTRDTDINNNDINIDTNDNKSLFQTDNANRNKALGNGSNDGNNTLRNGHTDNALKNDIIIHDKVDRNNAFIHDQADSNNALIHDQTDSNNTLIHDQAGSNNTLIHDQTDRNNAITNDNVYEKNALRNRTIKLKNILRNNNSEGNTYSRSDKAKDINALRNDDAIGKSTLKNVNTVNGNKSSRMDADERKNTPGDDSYFLGNHSNKKENNSVEDEDFHSNLSGNVNDNINGSIDKQDISRSYTNQSIFGVLENEPYDNTTHINKNQLFNNDTSEISKCNTSTQILNNTELYHNISTHGFENCKENLHENSYLPTNFREKVSMIFANSTITFKVICIVLATLGCLGNLFAISITALSLDSKNTYYSAIFGLALADVLAILKSILLSFYLKETEQYLGILFPIILLLISEINSAMQIIVVSSVKYLLIVHAIKSRRYLTNTTVGVSSFICFVFSVACSVGLLLGFGRQIEEFGFVYSIALFIVPFIFLTIQHLLIMRKIRSSEAAKSAAAKVNLVVSIILVLYLTYSTTNVGLAACTIMSTSDLFVEIILQVKFIITLLIHSVNPILYFCFTPVFRSMIRDCMKK